MSWPRSILLTLALFVLVVVCAIWPVVLGCVGVAFGLCFIAWAIHEGSA